jgi:hypothetical protein
MSSPIVIRLRHGILRVEPHIVGLSFRSAEKHFEFIHDGFFVVFMSSDNTDYRHCFDERIWIAWSELKTDYSIDL